MTHAQIAFNKFASYIESCTNNTHVAIASVLVGLYKCRFPAYTVNETKLSCLLQLKRIELEYLHEITLA